MEIQKQNLGVSQEQQIVLCDFMKTHTDLAKGILKTAEGRKTTQSLWVDLTNILNEIGPPIKQAHEWKKTWSDMKYKTKSKLAFNKFSIRKTGGGPFRSKPISDMEESIIQCAGLEAAVSGLKTVKSFGCPSTSTAQSISSNAQSSNAIEDFHLNEVFVINNANLYGEDTEIELINKENNVNTNNKKEKPKKRKDELMEKFVKSTEEINETIKKVVEEMKENRRVLKRQLELEEKMYQLQKRKAEDDKKFEKEKLQMKKHI